MDDLTELPYKVPATTLPFDVERVVQAFVLSGNATQSFISVYGEGQVKNPGSAARSMLNRPEVRARLQEHQHAISLMSAKSTETLTRELEEMVDADVNEIMQLKVGSCRHCWGLAGFYQWRDEREYLDACAEAMRRRAVAPEMTGGYGYLFSKEPNRECAQCEGDGIQRVVLAPTDGLSPGARRLYQGIELYPDGSIKKIKLQDQTAARQELHRIRGMHIERSVSVGITGKLPDAREIANDTTRALAYLDGLKRVK